MADHDSDAESVDDEEFDSFLGRIFHNPYRDRFCLIIIMIIPQV